MLRRNEKTFTFKTTNGYMNVECYTTTTKHGYCHTAKCYPYTDTKKSYEGRTWECFEYESVLWKFANKLDTADCDMVKAQLTQMAEDEHFKADEAWFNQFKKDYDGLHDNTKKHLANAMKDTVITSTEQAEGIMAISKAFDFLLNI